MGVRVGVAHCWALEWAWHTDEMLEWAWHPAESTGVTVLGGLWAGSQSFQWLVGVRVGVALC